MNELISRSTLVEQLTEWANRNEMMGYSTACDVVRDCIGVVKSQPTVDEKEIIRKYGEQIIDKMKVLLDLVNTNQRLSVMQAMDIVKEECGINE